MIQRPHLERFACKALRTFIGSTFREILSGQADTFFKIEMRIVALFCAIQVLKIGTSELFQQVRAVQRPQRRLASRAVAASITLAAAPGL